MVKKELETEGKKLIAEILIKDGRITIIERSDSFDLEALVRALRERGLELKENFKGPCG
jgi:hypothetical protein